MFRGKENRGDNNSENTIIFYTLMDNSQLKLLLVKMKDTHSTNKQDAIFIQLGLCMIYYISIRFLGYKTMALQMSTVLFQVLHLLTGTQPKIISSKKYNCITKCIFTGILKICETQWLSWPQSLESRNNAKSDIVNLFIDSFKNKQACLLLQQNLPSQ